MYDAFDVACYIVNKCIDNGKPVSNLKLQKMLYYAQAAFLVEDKKLFNNEISAWRYGPVVEEVYYYFKKNVNKPITKKISPDEYLILDSRDSEIVDKVIEAKNQYDAFELVKDTHDESPWKSAINKGNNTISNIDIKNYFLENRGRIYN